MDTSRYIKVVDDIYSIDIRILPKSSVLYYILTDDVRVSIKKKHVNYKGEVKEMPYIDQEDSSIDLKYFSELMIYLNTGKVGNVRELHRLLEFFNIFTFKTKSYKWKFKVIKLEEEWDRRNRYNPYFEEIFKDPYLNLVKLVGTDVQRRLIAVNLALSNVSQSNASIYSNLLKEGRHILDKANKTYGKSLISGLNTSHAYSQESLNLTKSMIDDMKILLNDIIYSAFPSGSRDELDQLFWDGHIVVSGGSIISILGGSNVNDIDCFFIGLDSDQIISKIEQILDHKDDEITVNRSVNAISIKNIQFILRSYKNVSEVIHGFDIDASCIAYDGSSVWATGRCIHALDNMVNIVDFDRLSPSYEYRLIKYMRQKLFSIYIPDFRVSKINWYLISTTPKYRSHDLRGLDYILYNCMSQASSIKMVSDYEDKGSFYNEEFTGKWLDEYDNLNINFNIFQSKSLDSIICIPYSIYKTGCITIPRKITIKVLSPGDQATNTFHVTVLEDISKWYEGRFYTTTKKI